MSAAQKLIDAARDYKQAAEAFQDVDVLLALRMRLFSLINQYDEKKEKAFETMNKRGKDDEKN